MKTKFILFVFILPICLFAQKNKLQTGQLNKLNESYLYTSVLLLTDSNQGTGIFVTDSSYIYFVTAGHCFYSYDTISKQYLFLQKKAQLTYYVSDVSNGSPSTINIDLTKAYKDSLIKFDKDHDIAIVAIGSFDKKNKKVRYFTMVQKSSPTGILAIYIFDCSKKYSEISIGNDIYSVGFPSSIGDQQSIQFDYSRPLLRKGIIAGKFENKKTIVIDCPAYPGNSGSPVYECVPNAPKNDSTLLNINESSFENNMYLIGINIQYIPYINKDKQKMNSDYSIVTPIDFVFDLLKKYK